jgi:RNA polymerase sigma factor (sigma-70 family)
MRDGEVVAAIVAGDPDGIAQAYDKYAMPLYSYCRSLLREPADAADAVQDTFLIATAKLGGLRDPGKLRSWLYAVARNECYRKLRSGEARSQLERSLGALVVARTGRDACPALDALLAGWDGQLTVLLRKRVSRHIEQRPGQLHDLVRREPHRLARVGIARVRRQRDDHGDLVQLITLDELLTINPGGHTVTVVLNLSL